MIGESFVDRERDEVQEHFLLGCDVTLTRYSLLQELERVHQEGWTKAHSACIYPFEFETARLLTRSKFFEPIEHIYLQKETKVDTQERPDQRDQESDCELRLLVLRAMRCISSFGCTSAEAALVLALSEMQCRNYFVISVDLLEDDDESKHQQDPSNCRWNKKNSRRERKLVLLVHNEQDGQNDERQQEREVGPDPKHVPLLVVAVTDQALCLKVHATLVQVDSAEFAISEPTVARLGKETMEAFDDPLAFKLRLIDNGLAHIPAEQLKSGSFRQGQVLYDSQED